MLDERISKKGIYDLKFKVGKILDAASKREVPEWDVVR